MLAVIGVPTARTNLLKCLNVAGVPGPNGKQWRRQDINDFLDLEAVEAMCRVIVEWGSTEYYTLYPTAAGLLWDEAVRMGEFEQFDDAVEAVLSLNVSAVRDRFFATRARGLRALRRALARGDEELLFKFWEKVQNSAWRWHEGDAESVLAEAMSGLLYSENLKSLPLKIAEAAFPLLFVLTLNDSSSYQAVAQSLFDYPSSNSVRLELFRAERLIMHGRLEEAETRLETIEAPQAFSLKALLALSRRGDEAEARRLYEAGLKEMGKGGFYQSWTGIFYPILLYKAGADEKKLKGYVKTLPVGDGMGSLSPLEPLLRKLLKIEQGAEEEGPKTVTLKTDGLRSFPCLLLLHWLGKRDKKLREAAATLAYQFDERGLTFLASELRAAWDLSDPEKPSIPYPLCGLLRQEEEWERSLSALINVGGVASAQGSGTRIAWRVDWFEGRGGELLSLALTPVEQTMQKTKWSKGRNISLRRLYKEGSTLPGMTPQDVRAASAVRVSRNYYGTEYWLDIPKALSFLDGHPFVFRGETEERVEISVSDPILSVREGEKGYEVELCPFPEENENFSIILEGPNHLRVTPFELRHLRVARILGPSGLSIPAQAKEPLMKALESLASIVTVQSDFVGVGGAAEEIEADGRIFVQLQPDGAGLAVETVVRPFGSGSVSCYPGQGGAALLGTLEGKRVRALRDLKAESDAFLRLQTVCPALMEGEPVGDGWRLSEPGLALEFLSQLQEMGDSIVLEWPKGQSMRLAYPSVGAVNFTATIRQTRDWFALSGEIRVNEDLVLGMKTLLENLKGQYGRFVPLGNGEFLALTREFQRRLETLSSLGEERDGEVLLPLLAAGVAEDLLEGAEQIDAAKEWRSRLSLIAEAENLSPALPSTLKVELRDYQLEGFRWLMRLAHWGAGACLADDMGLGKTLQALAVLVARGGKGPSLVVAPTSVCSNWAMEAGRFTPTLRVRELRYADREELLSSLEPMDLVVASYGILQTERERLCEIDWNVIVLDEAQAIKNMGTKRSSAAMKLKGDFRVATTGTPIENQLSELWNLFRFLNPGYLGSFESFWRRFGGPIERNGDKEARRRLRQMIRPFILRRTKEQVLKELPSKTEITLTVDLKDEERAFYEALRRNALEELSTISSEDAGQGRFQVLAALMRLRRACCSTSLVNADINLPSAKLEAFADVLAELRSGGHKALVFSQFVDHLSILRAWLDREKVPYHYLDGSTPPEERKKRVVAFQSGEGDCFLISLKAGGTGLNLTAADYVIHMDPWWNPAVEDQASDRAHRIGQERPVTVYRIVARNTIEEKIVALHEWKRDLADGLLEDSGTAVHLSVEDLLNLIRE